MEEEIKPVKRVYIKKNKIKNEDIEVKNEPNIVLGTPNEVVVNSVVPIVNVETSENLVKRISIKKSKIKIDDTPAIVDTIPDLNKISILNIEQSSIVEEKPKRKYTKKVKDVISPPIQETLINEMNNLSINEIVVEEKPKRKYTKKGQEILSEEIIKNVENIAIQNDNLTINEEVIIPIKRVDEFDYEKAYPELMLVKRKIENVSKEERYNILTDYYTKESEKKKQKKIIEKQEIYALYTIEPYTNQNIDKYMYISTGYVTGNPPSSEYQTSLYRIVYSISNECIDETNIMKSFVINRENIIYRVCHVEKLLLCNFNNNSNANFFVCRYEDTIFDIIKNCENILNRTHYIEGIKTMDIISNIFE